MLASRNSNGPSLKTLQDLKISFIFRHVGRKYNLYGKNMSEASEIDMLIDTAADIQNAIVKIIFSPECVRLHTIQ